jgi:cardiolipin synthase
MRDSCKQIVPEELERQHRFGDVVRSFIAFHLVRLYPIAGGPAAAAPPRLAPAMPRRRLPSPVGGAR